MDYLYDGTFEGLLTCIYFHYKKFKATGIYESKSYQQSITNTSETVSTDAGRARIVSKAIETKISKEAYLCIYYCYLSNQVNKENDILNFVVFGFKYGNKTMNFYTHEMVYPVRQAYVKVSREEQKFLGILRFADIGGVLYAKYSPDNDLTTLIADHFADRYKYEKFIICDEKRKKACIYADGMWQIKDVSNICSIEYSDDEKAFQKLWRQYFTELAIKERTNINLQFQFVPSRYRKNMPEFQLNQQSKIK